MSPVDADRFHGMEIAIVGMAGRFPKAADLDIFWRNVRDGVDCISSFTERQMEEAGVPPALRRDAAYVPAGGVLEDADLFDAAFFQVNAREAEITDPQQRVFLECCWQALEDAGYDPDRFDGGIGVYGGVTFNTYLARVLADPANAASLGRFQIVVASDKDFLASRVAYKLNLRGPAVVVQTACSTSLVAIHLACQALLAGECQMALAGGSSIVFPQEGGYLYQPDGIFSPDGRCRAFDANAQGTVGGRGAGVVVLKPLQAALDDGDEVYAVVKGSAINNDGAFKVGFTAPAIEGQTRVLRAAYAVARVDPDTVTYVEAHGTGTALGDPVEIAALTRAFRASTDRTQFCAIGSLKSNIGHLDAAAGVAGVIKTALALHHREIPPTLHVEQPNPAIGFEQTPFRVATRLSPWPANGVPRRAGVSAFGVGGTNAHVVLEEAPEPEPSGPSRPAQLVVLSARSLSALERRTDDLAAHLRAHPEQPLADVALTCQQGRQAFPYRRALVCRDAADAATALESREPRRLLARHRPRGDRPVAFLFPGQGTQHANMARELYTHEPTFRAWIDRCAAELVPHLGADLRDVLYPSSERLDEANRRLEQTAWAQPALFVVELALAQLWMEWGVRPEAMIGHSVGEYVAACVAGVWSIEEALALVAARGRLVQALPAGAMLAVSLPDAELRPMLDCGASVAAINGPALSVASGPLPAIAALEARLAEAGVSHQRLHTSHAFHSDAMDPILEAFAAEVRRVRLHAPSIPIVSNVTGRWIDASEATDPAYWVSHLRQTVRFGDGLATLLQDAARVPLEVGPGNVLCRLVQAHPERHAEQTACASLGGARAASSDVEGMLEALARLWLAGVPIDWRGFSRHERRRRVRLPAYPFERRRFWVGAAATHADGAAGGRHAASQPGAGAALPAMSEGPSVRAHHPRPDLPVAYVVPRNDLETRVAALWEDLLGVAPIGAHDHFFELGGHSLLATQLTEALRRRFHVDLPTRALTEAPTVEQLAAAIAARAAAGDAPSDAAGAPPAILPDPGNRHVPFPLTDVQQAYWIGRSGAFDLGQVATHSYMELQRRGLDLPRLTVAWRRMIERHDMLRAVVLPEGLQQILERVPPYDIAVQDLRDLPAEDREAALQAVRQQMSHQVLPADRWPLFDLRASRLDDDVVRLHVSFDLLIGDGWSWHILWRELLQFYEESEVQLPPLPLSFRDCVLAEIAAQDSAAYRAALAYWLERIPTLPPGPELPLRGSIARLDKPRFERRSARLPVARWSALKARATAAGLTPSGVLLAAFAEVLAAWSRPSRFTLNLTLFNRPPVDPAINRIIGDFTSLTMLAVDAQSGDTFETRARRVQAQLFDDLDHRQVGGVRVLRELARLRGGSARPLMPVVFTSGLAMGDEAEGGLDENPFAGLGEMVYSISQTPQVLIDHQVGQRAGALVFNWDVVEEALAPGVLEAMFSAYCALLERLADDETVWRAHRLDLIPPSDLRTRAQINATAAVVPQEHLHTPFLRQTRACPDRPALIWPHGTMTYGELDRRANQLAHRLRRLGAGAERLIGVCLDKGWEQVVAVIAILRAGAAYLPVGPKLPLERQRFLLDRGNAAIVVTHEESEDLRADGRQIVPLHAALWQEESAEDIDDAPGLDRLAYVIFTSGSTGVPKGVMIEHGAAVNTVLDVNRRFAVGPADRVLALSDLSFDLSVYDIFGTLAAGGAIVMPSPDTERDPEHWMRLAADGGVTIWNSVPALMQMAVDVLEGRSESLPRSLRLVMLSGDWLPVPLPDRIRQLNSQIEVVSLGGATEAAIWSICHPVGVVDPSWPSIPYGRPMANQTFHVLDRRMEPCPTWVPGELYIGGIGVARGYWRDEERTRASFVTHPASGERLYRTGDLGRYWPDGEIEFLGREDFQVKVQGHRIELSEIEVVLGQHPLVKAAAVAAIGDPRGEKRLVAYVVPGDAAHAHVEEILAAALRGRLPEYMVPDTFVMLEALPLTANGKVDRAALPHPTATERDVTRYVAPRDELEHRLASVWADVLGVDAVGITDSFFAHGGHSLSAVRLVARLEREFGRRIPLGMFFRQPTIESMATLIRMHDAAAGESVLLALQPDGDRPPIFWVHGAGGHVFSYAALARALGVDQPFFAFQFRADADRDGPPRIEEMAADYCRELRRVRPEGPYQIGGWSMGGIVAFEMARQLIAAGAEVRHLAVVDAWAPEVEAAAAAGAPALLAFARELGAPPDPRLHAMSEAARDRQTPPASFFQRMKDLGLLREDEDVESVTRLFGVFDRNLQALASYAGGPYPGRIALFQAANGQGLSTDDPSAGWRPLARDGVELHIVEGDHHSILADPHVTRLAELLRNSLGAPAAAARSGGVNR